MDLDGINLFKSPVKNKDSNASAQVTESPGEVIFIGSKPGNPSISIYPIIKKEPNDSPQKLSLQIEHTSSTQRSVTQSSIKKENSISAQIGAGAAFVAQEKKLRKSYASSCSVRNFGVKLMLHFYTMDELTDPDVNISGNTMRGNPIKMN